MSALKPISREYRIYLALWRKAYLTGPFNVKVSSHSMALAMRQGLYRAISPYRVGTALDAELLAASEKYVTYLLKLDDPKAEHTIEFRERKVLAEMESGLLAELGIMEDDLLLGDERSINDSLRKLMADVEGPAAAASVSRSTPFFDREG